MTGAFSSDNVCVSRQLEYGCVSHSHSLLSAHLKLGLPQLLLMSASAILLVLDSGCLHSSVQLC